MYHLEGTLYTNVDVEIPITIDTIFEVFDVEEFISESLKKYGEHIDILSLILNEEKTVNCLLSDIYEDPELKYELKEFLDSVNYIEDEIKGNPEKIESYLDLIDFKDIVAYVKRHQRPASEHILGLPPTDHKVPMPECKPPKKPLHEMTLLEIVKTSLNREDLFNDC